MDRLLNMVADALQALQGKKAYILAIFTAINSYAVAAGIYDANVGALINTILSILAGGAVVATNKMGARMGRSK